MTSTRHPRKIFTNATGAIILVWVEPWAVGYDLGPGQSLSLLFGLGDDQPDVQIDLSSSTEGETCVTVWVSLSIQPTAIIDGCAVEPSC